MAPRAAILVFAAGLVLFAGPGGATPLPPAKPAATAAAESKPAVKSASEKVTRASLCLMVESAARANGLPVAFLTRVIWRESRFDPMAVGPVTRGGSRAEGIAQFMPGTAAERALADPFDPVQALPKAAAFLRELAERFGNLGLAAAAYNAGPHRVQQWLGGAATMPGETRAYVRAITGRSVEDWAKPKPEPTPTPKDAKHPTKPAGEQSKEQSKASGAPAHPGGKADENAGEKADKKPNKEADEKALGKKATEKPKRPANCETTLASLDQPPGDFAFELNRRVTAAIGKPWGVELAAGFTREKVMAQYARAMRRLAAVIGDQDPILTRARVRFRGASPFYQARIGADSRPAATTLCTRIRRAGGACLVLRNFYR